MKLFTFTVITASCILLLTRATRQRGKEDDGFVFSIDHGANFTFSRAGRTWLQSSPAFLYTDGQRSSAEDGSLVLRDVVTTGQGVDKGGQWKSTCFLYTAESHSANRSWTLCAKRWLSPSLSGAVVFQQHFPDGTNNSAREVDNVISGFPSFQVPREEVDLSYLAYQGNGRGGIGVVVDRWQTHTLNLSGGIEGGPLAVFDQNQGVCIIAPFSQFMTSSRAKDEKGCVNWGVMGGVGAVPKDFLQETMVFCGTSGINEVFADWGKFMRQYYEKDEKYRNTDLTVNYLGYWTDAGAYYYYNTELNKNYEQTILDVKNYSDSVHLPFRYVQYGSWFYAKGPEGGVTTWQATPSISPHGFRYLFNKTRWPSAAQNTFWSSKTPYAKANGGRYDFIVEEEKALPQDPEFWMDLFKEARTWGLTMYDQDRLDGQFRGLRATQSRVDVAASWMDQMGWAARALGVSLTYSRALPRHALHSLMVPAVTQVRFSDSYRAGDEQWRIGEVSIWADALGIAPFKDTFWTIPKQPGNTYNLLEPNTELQVAVATLSTGSVGPSDSISHANVSMLMQCCRADGLILKPSKPATAIDRQFWQRAWGKGVGPEGEVWTTLTHIGPFHFGIILAAAMDHSPVFNLTPADAGFRSFSPEVVITRSAHSVTPEVYGFGPNQPLMLTSLCSRQNFCMYYTSPVFTVGTRSTKIVLYGEEYKFVPVSAARFSNIDVTSDDVVLTLEGVAGESTTVSNFMDGEIIRHTCTFGATGRATLSLRDFHSSCQDL
ncbi:uncharacterized protein LOC143286522 [Babylonia areolata]|uniref:uncharacterized protein LOC143286522 n=1 Tax=Babylonia areolata TaxID=304850 RepID=UPI003FD17291